MAKKVAQKEQEFHQELIKEFVALSTSGFGLVAALAWNEAIQGFVQEYIEKYFPSQYGVISKFIYAILISILAIFITYQISRLAARWGVNAKN